jgi:FAD/FMN-containing dehydrogenase
MISRLHGKWSIHVMAAAPSSLRLFTDQPASVPACWETTTRQEDIMATEQITTLDGRDIPLSAEALDSFRMHVSGDILEHGDPGYDEARRLWNGMHDKYPALIARCTGTADVVAAVNFAREQGLLLSVRGGGHNVAGTAAADGALMIDLSGMRGVHVDPARMTARAQAGARWGDVDRETQLHGLVTPGGEISTTGIAGYTLSGGMGLLQRKWGLACDNLLAVEIVTAAGEVLTASEAEHPDLFWAVRGGGGNFGVVTSFEYRLYQFGPEVYVAAAIYPTDHAEQILDAWCDFTRQAPDEITSQVMLWSVPEIPEIATEHHGKPALVVLGMYAGPAEVGEQALSQLRALREIDEPICDLSEAAPYVTHQNGFDDFFPEGDLYYWKSLTVDELTPDVNRMILRHLRSRPSSQTLIALRHLGGAMSRVPEDATAYGNRSAQYNISIDGRWLDPAESDVNIAWVRQSWDELHRHSGGGVYLNFAGFAEDVEALAKAGHQKNYDRLRQVKRHYDPTNLFRMNINIKP